MGKDFLAITDLSTEEIQGLFQLALDIKKKQKGGIAFRPLEGKTLAMIFQKPSTRTRISFEVGMYQLGGYGLYLSPSEIGLGKRESVSDVARVLSRFNDGIMARLFGHDLIVELAQFASIPVINGLTDRLHPCQILGDLLTILEHRGSLEELKVTYVGDGNNVAHSWINAAARLPFRLNLGCPKGYDPDTKILKAAKKAGLSDIKVFRDPMEAVRGSDIIYTDVWASMGQEKEAAKRKKAFKGFKVNKTMLKEAGSDVKVMHCLPAHRGEEISHYVMESPNSIVFDEAENRLHIQKAIMVHLMS
ncbi:ornithine carbamoyltransferase [bacterium I07]|nr:ornithine carbamoyltransferase [bacterium I07]